MQACTPLRSQLFWSTTCCAVKTHNGEKVSLQPLKKDSTGLRHNTLFPLSAVQMFQMLPKRKPLIIKN